MRWWSEKIMGGDLAYEYRRHFIHRTLKLKHADHFFLTRGNREYYAGHINKRISTLLNVATSLEKIASLEKSTGSSQQEGIAGQVLGVLIMENGASMPPHVKDFILKCARLDAWAQTNPVRKERIEAFIDDVQAYRPGTALKAHSETQQDRSERDIGRSVFTAREVHQ